VAIYHIELRNVTHIHETVDVEMADLSALRVEVARFVGEMLKDHAAQVWEDQDWQVVATDERGLILFTISVFASDTAATMPRRHP
jgi:hypothetical protein